MCIGKAAKRQARAKQRDALHGEAKEKHSYARAQQGLAESGIGIGTMCNAKC